MNLTADINSCVGKSKFSPIKLILFWFFFRTTPFGIYYKDDEDEAALDDKGKVKKKYNSSCGS